MNGTMVPFVPTSLMAMPSSKPKIGFSIDSIVGSELNKSGSTQTHSPRSENSDRVTSPISDYSYPINLQKHIKGTPYDTGKVTTSSSPPPPPPRSSTPNSYQTISRAIQSAQDMNGEMERMASSKHLLRLSSQSPTGEPVKRRRSRSSSPPLGQKDLLAMPQIQSSPLRPVPVQPPNVGLQTPDMIPPHNQHFFAAHFQMAAASLASGQIPQPFPGMAPGFPPIPPPLTGSDVTRTGYPLYPWLLNRHGRMFPNRFPVHFLIPFRKPKRVRTAFSPSQLLKLEHAFESNHYMVGAERKALAQSLCLSETQVKVWFQNRRTKHKRMQQEDESGDNKHNMSSSGQNADGSRASFDDEEELIDMDEYDSEDEHEAYNSHR